MQDTHARVMHMKETWLTVLMHGLRKVNVKHKSYVTTSKVELELLIITWHNLLESKLIVNLWLTPGALHVALTNIA
jgi:hypothetical protein